MLKFYSREIFLQASVSIASGMVQKAGEYLGVQSSQFVVSPQYNVSPATRSTNSYPALQIFTCYMVSPVTLPDFGGPDIGTISGLDCITKNSWTFYYVYVLQLFVGVIYQRCLYNLCQVNS